LNRRELLILAGGTVTALPLRARAQQKAMPVVGYLHPGSSTARPEEIVAFRDGLAQAGYVDGNNVSVKLRWGEGRYDRLADMVAELVRERVDVILAYSVISAVVATKATTTIPIVFLTGDDPIKHGLVASLSRPGGNATGVSMLTAGLSSKRLGLLRELVPGGVPLVAVLLNPRNPNADAVISEAQDAARGIGQPIEFFNASSEGEIDGAFAAIDKAGAKGFLEGADPFYNDHRKQIIGLAARYRIPAIYEWREFPEDGGLMSYGTSLTDVVRQLGHYTGRVLRGEKPADLPVLQPTKFEFVINLKTARELGLTVPQVLLAQTDEVIE
jgi:putative ABC transport system substrate-binding protein